MYIFIIWVYDLGLLITYLKLLGWPKYSFRFFHTMLWKTRLNFLANPIQCIPPPPFPHSLYKARPLSRMVLGAPLFRSSHGCMWMWEVSRSNAKYPFWKRVLRVANRLSLTPKCMSNSAFINTAVKERSLCLTLFLHVMSDEEISASSFFSGKTGFMTGWYHWRQYWQKLWMELTDYLQSSFTNIAKCCVAWLNLSRVF